MKRTETAPREMGRRFLTEGYLECLWAVVCGAVVFGGGKKRRVIRLIANQRGHELIGGEAAESPVFRRQDDVRATPRARDQTVPVQPTEREPSGGGSSAQPLAAFLRSEVMVAPRVKVGDEVAGSVGRSNHSRVVTIFDTLRNR